jgi:hypothetical protein
MAALFQAMRCTRHDPEFFVVMNWITEGVVASIYPKFAAVEWTIVLGLIATKFNLLAEPQPSMAK